MIVQPESEEITVNGNSVYFCGCANENEQIYINGNLITPEKNGAFSCIVPLKEGENFIPVGRLLMFEDMEIYKYTVTSDAQALKDNKQKFRETAKTYYMTNSDNTILRSTPVDGGINRLGYLPKDTKLFTDAEQNGFTRVYLAPNLYGWVITGALNKMDDTEYKPNKLVSEENIQTDYEEVYKITLSDNCPYSAECKDNKLIVNIFNLDSNYKKEISLPPNPRYSVEMKDKVLTVKVKKIISSNKTIVIDPGHGGIERGAIGCFGDKEKDLTLNIALKLSEILKENGYNPVLTRSDDSFVALNNRVKIAKENDAVLFVSIHLNSVPLSDNPQNHTGTKVYYYNPQSEMFAKTVAKTVSSGLKVKNNGTVQASFAVVRPTDYIGILVEPLFLVNPKDTYVYCAEDFSQKAAQSLFNGINEYINKK